MTSNAQKSLYISDLDGTLLASGCFLSSSSKKIVLDLLAQDVAFTIATARGIFSIKEILGDIPFQLPVICNNGAYIRDYKTMLPLRQSAFESATAGEILAICGGYDLAAFVTSNDGKRDWLSYDLILNQGMQWFLEDRLRANDPRLEAYMHHSKTLSHKITCLTIIGTLEKVVAMQNEIEGNFSGRVQSNIMINPYQSEYHWLTVQDISTSKGNAVRWMADNFGFSLENTTVFGDQVNDISMFEVAGQSCAMEHAVPALRERATKIIGGNNEDAVPLFVQKDVLSNLSAI